MKKSALVNLLGAALLATTLAACQPADKTSEGVGAEANWTDTGGGKDESGYSRLAKINTRNVGKLGLASFTDLPDDETLLEATPIAVDGMVYFTGTHSRVYAVDPTTGKILWTFDPEIWRVSPGKLASNFGANRGVAYDNGKIFLGALDGRLIALDAKTGTQVWSTQTVPKDNYQTVTGAPRVFKGKVIIGNTGGDLGVRGRVAAYDQATGKEVWHFFLAPGAPEENKGDPTMEMIAKTWTGEWWKTGTGGAAWSGFTFDPELNRIYIGAGNAGPYDPAIRSPGGGDNLFIASIVAVDADTGKYVWHYQQNPREAWDYKSIANMISATIQIDGKPRKVLMQVPTNGFFYVLDRETGKLISAEKVGKVTWAEKIDLKTGRPVEAPNIRYEKKDVFIWPGPIGAHSWHPMSYSPKTGLVYVPYMQMPGFYTTNPLPGAMKLFNVSMVFKKVDPDDGKGKLIAWDPVAQKARWKIDRPYMWNGGILSTAGDLVFQGTGDGVFAAYDAENGKELWKFNPQGGIVGQPISYTAKGKQYVSVLVGYGGGIVGAAPLVNPGWKFGRNPRRMLTFAIGGDKALPTAPGPRQPVKPLDDPSIVLKNEDVWTGQALFGACGALCHGVDAVGAGAQAPDLRESSIAMSEDALWEVVHNGALEKRGMPRYPQFTREQVHQIWSYIRARAREELGVIPKGSTTPPPEVAEQIHKAMAPAVHSR